MQWLAPIQLPRSRQAIVLQERLRTFHSRVAGGVQHLLGVIEDAAVWNDGTGRDRISRLIGGNQRLVTTLLQDRGGMTIPQLQQAWRDLVAGMNEMLDDSTDDEEDPEEGEIDVEDPFTTSPDSHAASADSNDDSYGSQDLPSLSLLDTSVLDPGYQPRSTRHAARSSDCPLCRQLAFVRHPGCHSDTIQLMRVRLRLTDIAYACFRFDRSPEEQEERNEIAAFLERRYDDNIMLGEVESTPSALDCRQLFTRARATLRKNAYKYMHIHPDLSAAERLRVMQLTVVFENFRLKDGYIPYFFDPTPALNEVDYYFEHSVEETRVLNEDPKRFFEEMDVVAIFRNGPTAFEPEEEMIVSGEDEEDGENADDEEDEDSVG